MAGRPFTLVDTGGIGLLRREKSDDVIIKAALEQVEIAIEAANAIILVVNVQEGVVPLDREVAERCAAAASRSWSRSTKWTPTAPKRARMNSPQLGFEKIFPVSAIHGEGIQNLMNEAVAFCQG